MEIFLENLSNSEATNIKKWKSDKELSKLILSKVSEITLEEAIKWIELNSNDNNQVLKGIFIKENNEISCVGIARLMFIDKNNSNAEIGIYIGNSKYKGLGIGVHAIKLIERIAFGELILHKIYAKVVDYNKISEKLFIKSGFKEEGKLRNHFFNSSDNIFSDIKIFSKFNKNKKNE